MTDSTTQQPPERNPDADLRPSDRLVLRALREHGGDLRRNDAIEASGLPSNTARDAMTRLVTKGYAERRPTPTDARGRRWVVVD